MMRRFAVHPLFIAAFFVLTLWSQNLSEVSFGAVWRSLLVVVAGVGVAFGLAVLAVRRDHRRIAVAVSGVTLLFFSYGYVWDLVNRAIAEHRYLLLLMLVVAAMFVFAAFKLRRHVAEMTTILNGVGVVLLVTAMLPVAQSAGEAAPSQVPVGTPGYGVTAIPDRDIYYIILDRYGSEKSLRALFDYDNHPFMAWLEQRDFSVAYDSLGNYNKTAHSLGASLNLDYLDDLATAANHNSGDWGPVYAKLRDHQIGRFLTRSGYEYVHVGTWWGPTATATSADVTYRYGGRSEFSQVLLHTTAVPGLRAALGLGGDSDTRLLKRNATLYQFDKLEDIARAESDQPRFVFAHLTIPHEPYVFDADGSLVTQEMEDVRSRARNYTAQVEYANLRMQRIVELLLDGPEDEHPIIVLQADEGPHPVLYEHLEDDYNWANAPTAELQEKLRILNAYYLPELHPDPVYRDITPVNTFRVILREYFGADLGLLPDRSFVFIDENHLYDFVEVTDRVDGDESLPDPHEGRYRRSAVTDP